MAHFSDCERESLASDICIPNVHDILGDDRRKLFKKKAVRAKKAPYLQRYAYSSSYSPYWCEDNELPSSYGTAIHRIIGADGRKSIAYYTAQMGVRPCCFIDPDAEVFVHENGGYCLVPFDVEERRANVPLDFSPEGTLLDFFS